MNHIEKVKCATPTAEKIWKRKTVIWNIVSLSSSELYDLKGYVRKVHIEYGHNE